MSVSSQVQEWIDSDKHFSEDDIVRIAQNRASWMMMMMMTMNGNHQQPTATPSVHTARILKKSYLNSKPSNGTGRCDRDTYDAL